MSDTRIKDGTGLSYSAKVDSSNRLTTAAVTTSGQSYFSRINEDAYQVWGQVNIDTSSTPILYLENTSSNKDLVVTYIRVATAGAADTNPNAYFAIMADCEYVSGGAVVTPINMNVGSARAAEALCYSGSTALTLTSGNEIDRNFEANTTQVYNKEGSLILKTGASMCIHHIGSTVSGVAYARISFYYKNKGDV